jgi:hypothetical protein
MCRRKNVSKKSNKVIIKMNLITQEQLSITVFNCSFCNYQTNLDLRECPECGRIKDALKPKINKGERAVEQQLKQPKSTDFSSPITLTPQAESSVYECENCQYRTRNPLWECPECGRLKFAKIIASGSNDDEVNDQKLYTRRKTRPLANKIIFENYHVFYVIVLCALTFPAYFFRSELSLMLIYLLSMVVMTLYFLLNYCLSVTVGIDGISQKNLFGGWNASWSEITGWNEYAVGDGKTSICFRTGANVYRISPDILNPGRVKKIKEYFEEYCGEPVQGSDRIRGWLW